MQNVHSLNQDDVLSGDPKDDELSPSAFDDEADAGAAKKGGSKLVLFGGIGVAVLMVVFFAWKIFSPHFQSAQQQQPEGFDTLAAAPQHAPAPSPGAPQLLDPAAQPAPMPAPAVQEQAAAPAAAPAAGPAAPVGAGLPAQAAQPIQPIQPAAQQPVAAVAPVAPAAISPSPAAAATPAHAADGLAQVNARIDNLERSIAAIQDMVNKMAANANNAKQAAAAGRASASTSPAAAPAVKASRTASRSGSDRANVKKASASSAEPALAVTKSDPREERPVPKSEGATRATLKAVLDGRAWFQTKSGETLTVSVGEEVPGLGVVKSIDTDLGEVRFANGLSVR